MTVCSQVDPAPECLDPNRQFWWYHSGRFLQFLLQQAGYGNEAQQSHLQFFHDNITQYLGVGRDEPNHNSWESFMTDDGFPVEFSWDWGSGGTTPTIRFSIEPVGLLEGSKSAIGNRQAALKLVARLKHCLVGANFEWLEHFQTCFVVDTSAKSKAHADHSSHIFFGFDLHETATQGKAYYFPRYKADDLHLTTMNMISFAVRAAPHIDDGFVHAFAAFEQFAAAKSIEPEMLAIDLVEPRKSRIKVYFRLRDTRMSSVIEVASLGLKRGRPETELGILNLRRLWILLFGLSDAEASDPLKPSEHRTAGVLYYAEFKIGALVPKIKVYAPVRHYTQSDKATLQALASYFKANEGRYYATRYSEMMETLFSSDQLEGTGVHTYIGCTITPSGSLRIASYLNPSTAKIA